MRKIEPRLAGEKEAKLKQKTYRKINNQNSNRE